MTDANASSKKKSRPSASASLGLLERTMEYSQPAKQERLYSINALADFLDCHPFTVRRRIWDGEILAIKLSPRCIRVKHSEVEAYLARKPKA